MRQGKATHASSWPNIFIVTFQLPELDTSGQAFQVLLDKIKERKAKSVDERQSAQNSIAAAAKAFGSSFAS
jgi:hypothetical protein